MDNISQIETYRTYREAGILLNERLSKLTDKKEIMECASLLNMVENGTIYFDEEADTDRLAEFLIHDYYDKNGKNTVQKYFESIKYKMSSSVDKNIIQAKLEAKTSLHLVDYVKRDKCLIGLIDVFDNYNKIEIIDIALSQTIRPRKSYIFTRILKFDDFSSTAGVSYVFDKSKFKKIKKEYLKIFKSLPSLKSSTKKSISFFLLNRLYGKPVKYA